MRLVVSYRGVPKAAGWEAGACLARAFRELGHDVTDYGTYYGESPSRRVADRGLPSEIDLWVYVECGDSERQYEEVRTVNARAKVYWEFDTAIHRGFSLDFIQRMQFDHVFLGNWREADMVRTVHSQVHFLPYAVTADRLAILSGTPKTLDVGMVGMETRSRRRLMNALQRAGISAAILQNRYGDELVKTINSFKICLNCEVTGGKGLLNGRLWESLGCGGFLLNERGNGIETVFENGRHLVLFATEADCVAKARYYLDHPREAEGIARAGHEYAMAHHTYRQRAEAMLTAMAAPIASARRAPLARRFRAFLLRSAYRALGHVPRLARHDAAGAVAMPDPLGVSQEKHTG